jgi:hypothetical protein
MNMVWYYDKLTEAVDLTKVKLRRKKPVKLGERSYLRDTGTMRKPTQQELYVLYLHLALLA